MAKKQKESIYSFTPEGLTNLLVEEFGAREFVAGQLLSWLYEKEAESFEQMSNLSKDLRSRLSERFTMDLPKIHYELKSRDNKTIKLKLALADGLEIETVLMREKNHSTMCLSSQVGCAQACVFCATGLMGLKRNLTAGEIIAQYLVFKKHMKDDFPERLRLVYMGMGEPFHNTNQVIKSLQIFTHPKSLGIGSRRITISTSGVLKGIYRLAEAMPQVQLAISLHTVSQELRNKWIPNARESVEDILKAAREFYDKTGRRLTFEMVLFGGDYLSTSRINRLGKSLQGMPCTINAIPYNPIPGGPEALVRPGNEEVEHFKSVLKKWHKEVTVRISRGRDIQAACGQLIINEVA